MKQEKRSTLKVGKIPAKKAKVDPKFVQATKVSLDPYEHLTVDVHALINQHLNAKDVKRASLVCTEWCVQLGESKVAMEKLMVAPSRSTRQLSEEEFEEVFLQSRRRYSSLDFKCTVERHVAVMEKFVIKLAPSLVHVEVGRVNKSFKVPTASFPLLRSLEFTIASPFVDKFLKYFANEKLEKLALERVTKEAAEFLKSAKQLKELVIKGDAEVVLQDISGLTSCKFTKLNFRYIPNEATASIIKVLESQRSTLQSFGLIHDMNTFKYVMTMPEIKYIHFSWKLPRGLDGITPNQGIEKLRVHWMMDPQYFRPLLRLLPNLKQLQIDIIDREILQAISTSSMSIRGVYYKYCDNDLNTLNVRPPQMYEELQLASTGIFNNKIRLIQRSSGFDIDD